MEVLFSVLQSGYTIVMINGVFIDEQGAAENMDELKNTFRKTLARATH